MKLLRLSLVVTALVVLVSWTQTAEAKKKPKQQGEGTMGVVTSIDKDAKTFMLKTGKKKNAVEVTVKFDNTTEFYKQDDQGNTDKIKLDDLSPNSPVAVIMDSKDTSFANKVTIVPPEEKKKKK